MDRQTGIYNIIHGRLDEGYDFGYVGVVCSPELVAKIKDWVSANLIPDQILKAEDEPHITIKYGIHTKEPKEVAKIVQLKSRLTASFGSTSVFENDEEDILLVEVLSPDFTELNQLLTEHLKVTTTHPHYKPHLTLAYMKKGAAAPHVGSPFLQGQIVGWNAVVFSDAGGTKTEIKLSGDLLS